jgi:hypothetical protein
MKKTILSLFVAISLIGTVESASLYNYTISGGNISGSFDGQAFTDASYIVTALADPTTAFTAIDSITHSPGWYISNITPRMTLYSSGSSYSFDLLPINSLQNYSPRINGDYFWQISSVGSSVSIWNSLTGKNETYYSTFNGIIMSDGWSGFAVETATPLNNLQGTFFDAGTQSSAYGWTVPTSLGDLMVTSINNQASTFSITVVPEPSTYALFGIGAIGLMMVMRRKKTA